MNILAIIILAVLLLSTFSGYRNGFLKTVFSLVSWILVLAVCNIATPMVSEVLIETTEIDTFIQMTLDAKIEEVISSTMEEVGFSELPEVSLEGMKLEIPEELQASLPEEMKNLLLNIQSAEGTQVVDTAEFARKIVNIISLLLVMVFTRVAFMVVSVVFGIASKLPLIGPLDKMFGFVCGLGKGVIWSWVVLIIVSVLALTGTNTEWASYIAESQLLTWLQDNNVILNLLIK